MATAHPPVTSSGITTPIERLQQPQRVNPWHVDTDMNAMFKYDFAQNAGGSSIKHDFQDMFHIISRRGVKGIHITCRIWHRGKNTTTSTGRIKPRTC